MSLGRLLSSGKSLIGLRNMEQRYVMRTRSLLPKFGAPGNPFMTRKPEPLAPVNSARFQTEPRTLVAGTAPAAPEPTPTPVPAPTRTSAPSSAPAASSLPAVRHAGAAVSLPDRPTSTWARVRRWISWSNPFSRKSAGSRNGAVANGFPKGQLQGELSLENVRVVRNDLTDADLAVVPARVAGRSNIESPTEASPAELIKP